MPETRADFFARGKGLRMATMSLQVKVTLAIVAALLVIDGVGAAVAEVNFRQSETQHERAEAASRVAAIAHVLSVRFHGLGSAASTAAAAIDQADAGQLSADLTRAGFTSFVALGPDDSVRFVGGAATDAAVATELERLAPSFPTMFFAVQDHRMIVAVRSVDRQNAIVAAVDRQSLMEAFFDDVLLETDNANVVVSNTGTIIGTSRGFAAPSGPDLLEGDEVVVGGATYLAARETLDGVDGTVVHLSPTSVMNARADAMALRFLQTSTVATVLAGAATILLIRLAMRPLRRITAAAERLGRGEEDLELDLDSRDELGVLAGVLDRSAKQVGAARRQQEAHARELRSAAEDFQLAVGALSRSVGEADSAPELARRLADASGLVAPARGVIVLIEGALLEARALTADLDATSLRALFETARPGFCVVGEDEVQMALLREDLTGAERRKVEILLSQAKLALHRARALEKVQVYMDILSHDLKNPLAVARGRVEMASVKFPDAADRLQPAIDSLDRASHIIEEAVLHSKLERDPTLARSATDIVALAADAARALGPLAEARGIALRVDAPPRVTWPANPLLARAIENLVSNAIKWSPERSTVSIVVGSEREACSIRIVDHGPGIRAEDRARLFARFGRLERDGVKGVGLGLAIAKRVVDALGGHIRIEETPGGGATFVIELPAAPAARAPSLSSPLGATVPQEGQP